MVKNTVRVNTIGELREFLLQFPIDTPVRMCDDADVYCVPFNGELIITDMPQILDDEEC